MRTAARSQPVAAVMVALLLGGLAVLPPTSAAAADFDNAERIDVTDFTAAGIAVSQRVFPDGAASAILTRDDHFPDALSASALAAAVNGPVLFTDTDVLTSATATELDRVLDAGDTVHVAGGPAAISDGVVDELRDHGYQATRLAGETRVETAVKIAEAVGLPDSGRVLVARAFGPDGKDRTVGWVDSVTCGAYANDTTTPVLLTHTEALDVVTAETIRGLGATSAVICGGPAAVSDQVAEDLRSNGLEVQRVWGETRVETAVAAATQLFGYESAADRTALVVNGYGEQFGWGLAATPLAGALDAPILLADVHQPTSCADTAQQARATVCYLETVGDGSADVVVVGSTATVGTEVFHALAKAAGGEPVTASGGSLDPPDGVTVRNVSGSDEGRLEVAWDAVADPEGHLAGYNVYVGNERPDSLAAGADPTVDAASTTFTVGALQLDTTYQIAVTSLTDDGEESELSTAASGTTTAPRVEVLTPTSTKPVVVTPLAQLPVEFGHSPEAGGTYQLFHRLRGSDTWVPFPETPNGDLPALAGSPQSATVTAPDVEGVYSLRAAIHPDGPETVDTVEIGAFEVMAASGESVGTPEGGEAIPNGSFTLSFDYSTDAGGTYRLFKRFQEEDQPTWREFDETASHPGTLSPHSQGTESVTLLAPHAEGLWDLKVVFEPDGAQAQEAVGTGGLAVVVPEVSGLAPDESEPAVAGTGPQGGAVAISFTTNAGGRYVLDYALGDSGFTSFPEGAGAVDQGGGTVTRALPAPDSAGTYDLRVAFTPDAEGAAEQQSTEIAALHVASVTIEEPTGAEPHEVSFDRSNPDFSVGFALDTPVDLDYQVAYALTGTADWVDFLESPAQATPDVTNYEEEVTAPPTAPQERTYDLRVVVFPAGGIPEAGMPVSEEIGALVVEAPGVNLMTPRVGDPVHVAGGDPFTVTLRSDFAGDYVIEHRIADQDGEWLELVPDDDGHVEAGETASVTVTAPNRDVATHTNNTRDLRVTVVPDDPDEPDRHDVEQGALRVASVEILAPQGNPTVPADSAMDVELTANVDADYELVRRENGSGQDYEPFDPPAEGSMTADDEVTATIRTPDVTDGTSYDLAVLISMDGGATEHADDTEVPGFTVGSGTIDLVAPTGTLPAVTTSEGTFSFAFTVDHAGGYRLSASLDGSTWTSLVDCGGASHDPPDDNVAQTHNTGSTAAPTVAGTYDLRIQLFGSGDCFGSPLDHDTEDEALIVQQGA